MTAAAIVPRWTRPVPAWTPPLDAESLAGVLEKVRQWAPFDGGAVLDDVGAVLVDVVPGKEDIEELTRRLRGHLLRLVDIAVATEAGHKDQTADCLIGRARVLCAEGMADDRWTAVGHVRRMARCVNGLLELLVVVGCLKEAA